MRQVLRNVLRNVFALFAVSKDTDYFSSISVNALGSSWNLGWRGRKENKEVEEKKGERSFTLLTFLEGRLSADHFDLSPVHLSKWLFVLSQCLEQLQGKGLFTLLHHIEIIYFYNCGQLEKELGNKIGAKIKRTGEKIKDFKTGHRPVLMPAIT